MPHLVLLGDSILDNGSYTAPAPDTATLLQARLGSDWEVQLLAQDGATMSGVGAQLRRLSERPDVGVLSVGGNDALRYSGLLRPARTSTTEFLDVLATMSAHFAREYDGVVRATRPRVERLILCTIYEAPLDDPAVARLAHVPLSLLNDRIVRTAVDHGLEWIDLRRVCVEERDYTLRIEPSARGAEKIAHAIAEWLRGR